MTREYWVLGMCDLLGRPFPIQEEVRTAEEALKLGREWWEDGDMRSFVAIWVHDPRLGWCCYREMKPRGRWKNPRRGWVSRTPLAYCSCGRPATHARGTLCGECVMVAPICSCGAVATVGRLCRPCLDRETANVSGEELGAASAVLDRARRPSIVLSCPECGPLPHGPSCHQGERQ